MKCTKPKVLQPRTLSWLEQLVMIAAPIVLLLMLLAMTSMLYAHLLQVEHHLQRIREQLAQTPPQ